MKICIICQNIQTLGGLQVVVTSIARQLYVAKNVDVTFLMPRLKGEPCFPLPKDFPAKVLELDLFVPAENQKYKRAIRSFNRKTGCLDFSVFTPMMEHMLFSNESINRLADYVNSEKYDWVIGTAFNYSLLTALIADKVSCKTAGWMHSTFQGYYGTKGNAYYGLKCLNRKYLQRLNCCFVLNKKDQIAFDQNYGLNSIVLHNPIQHVSGIKKIHKKGELLFVGRLNKKVKGLDFLIDIVDLLNKRKVDFHLTIVGSGEDAKWLEQAITEKELMEKVSLEGFQQDVTPYYAQAYILLSTSRWEGFGMSIVEAMSAGTPCVSFDNDGACEIVTNGKNGALIPKYKLDDFALMIQTLFSDDALWNQMSSAAVERAKEFEVESIAAQMYQCLSEVNK